MNQNSRRTFLRAALLGGVAAYLPRLARTSFGSAFGPAIDENALLRTARDNASPIAPVTKHELKPGTFTGDRPSRAHPALWDKDNYIAKKGGIPKPTRTTDVVVVGGGIAGLTATYQLRDLKPVLLEQSTRFGGNAKGENWNGLVYGIGSAYVPLPDAKGPLGQLLSELDLLKNYRFESAEEEPALHAGKFVGPFWKGATDPAHAPEIERVYRELLRIENEEYPTIPAGNSVEQERLRTLDRLTFAQWVKLKLGPIHPHLEELFTEYCWDSLGGGYDELSAAQVLNFLTADLAGGACSFPGGNGAIAEAIYSKVAAALPAQNMNTGVLVLDITAGDQDVVVTFENAKGVLESIRAASCVVAAPKFIAKTIVSDLPEDQTIAMNALDYRAFLVANVLIDQKIESPHYGAFRIRDEVPPASQTEKQSELRAFTSVIFGGWASHDQTGHTALTLYKGFPYEGGRRRLMPESAFAEMRSRFEAEIPGVLASAGIDERRMVGLRIARWGHALPVARAGLISDGTLALAHRPHRGRVFFGQQDNWANPCVESAVTAASEAALLARQAAGRAKILAVD